jgi:AcrR family transcriptional regulator
MSRKNAVAEALVRSLELLWGTRSKVGRSGLNVKAIVDAAIALADRQGLDAVSMRRIADQLGAGTMSLYAHVPNKADLTALMIDRVLEDLYRKDETVPHEPGGWRESLRLIARRNWEVYQRHPWMLQVAGARPALGPSLVRKYEAELLPLDGLGLTDVEIDSALTLVLTHVEGTARSQATLGRSQNESGLSDGEWWTIVGPVLARVIDADQYPLGSRIGAASSEAYQGVADAGHALTFGLERILDGIALLTTQRRSSS